MGTRFRKTLRLFKALAVTASSAGVGVRAGVPGLNVSVGPSGTALNLGVPGTGLGYRVPLGEGGTRAEQRAWRAAARAEEAAQKAARLLQDAEAHVEAVGRLEALSGVLRQRWRAPFNLWEHVAPLPAFTPTPFDAHPFVPTPAVFEDEAERAYPLLPVVLVAGALVGLAAGMPVGPSVFRIVLTAVGLSGAVAVFIVRRLRRSLIARRVLEAGEEHERREARRRAEHAEAEARRLADHRALDSARAAVRACLSEGNAAPVAELFEQLTASMDFPVPVVAEVDFDDLTEADITLALPDLADVPEEKTSLTTRGRLSRRAMPKGERVTIYEDLCCGVALRLVYELLRFVPTLRRVRLRGMATRIDAQGHDEDFVALVLDVDRATLDGFDLDRVDPSEAAALLGRWGGNKRGALVAVA